MSIIKSQVFGFPVNMDEADITHAKVMINGDLVDLVDALDGSVVPGESTFEAYGGVGDGVTDNTAAFNAVLAAGVQTLLLGTGKVYRFSSAVNTITYGLKIVGASKSTTVLDFYQTSGNCLRYTGESGGGGMIEKLSIRNRGGATLTSAIYLQSQAAGGSPDYFALHDVNITGYTTSDLYSYGLLIDGNLRTASGIRDVTVNNVSIFNTTSSSWEVRNGRDIVLDGLSCFATGTGGVNLGQIDGADASTKSVTVRLNANMGDLYMDHASTVDVDGVYQGVYASANTSSFNIKGIATSVTIDASATNGRVAVQHGATISNSSSSTIVATVGGPASSTDNAIARFDGTTGRLVQNSAVTIADTTGVIAGAKFANAAGVPVLDSNASHVLGITTSSDLTADRLLTFVPGDASRTITVNGNPTLSDWFDQSVKTTDSPQFAAVNIGDATDTTITRAGAGDIAVEGNGIYRAGGTDVPVADGGTGASTARAAAQNLETWHVLARSGTAVSHTGNTNETALATISVPANSMGPNGVLRVTIVMSMTNNANGKTGRVRLGGLAGTSFAAVALANFQSWRHQTQIQNRNATNSQIATTDLQVGFGASTAAVITGALDTTSSQDLVISGTLTNSGDTITLESYLVELCYGA